MINCCQGHNLSMQLHIADKNLVQCKNILTSIITWSTVITLISEKNWSKGHSYSGSIQMCKMTALHTTTITTFPCVCVTTHNGYPEFGSLTLVPVAYKTKHYAGDANIFLHSIFLGIFTC